MILFDFRSPSVNAFNRNRRHIGIRIIIRIIYYPINGYPDSKLSVLSIPSPEAKFCTIFGNCVTVVAAARKPRDAAAVFFGLNSSPFIHYKFKRRQASKAQASELQIYWRKTEFNAKWRLNVFGVSGNAVKH